MANSSMSRNLYILSAALLLFAGISFAMSWAPGSNAPGLPGVVQMWRSIALFLSLLGIFCSLAATVTVLFEQVSRRHEQQQRQREH